MLVATTETVPGYRRVKTLGQVFGVVVRSRGLGGNILAGLRSIVGGEIHEYTALLEDARRQAVLSEAAHGEIRLAAAIIRGPKQRPRGTDVDDHLCRAA